MCPLNRDPVCEAEETFPIQLCYRSKNFISGFYS